MPIFASVVQGSISYSGSSVRETRMVSPSPSYSKHKSSLVSDSTFYCCFQVESGFVLGKNTKIPLGVWIFTRIHWFARNVLQENPFLAVNVCITKGYSGKFCTMQGYSGSSLIMRTISVFVPLSFLSFIWDQEFSFRVLQDIKLISVSSILNL